MAQEITIIELIKNHTLSADMAGLLWAGVNEKISFLTAALYRNAGKSTVSKALLSLRPKNISLHYVSDSSSVTEKLLGVEKRGGYLVVEEFSPADIPGYLWGNEAKHVFQTLKDGYSLQGSLHAESAENAITELTQGVGITDEEASQIQLVIFIEMFGATYSDAKRRVTNIFEVHRVENGKPLGHSIFTWNKDNDSFEMTQESHLFARDKNDVQKRSEILGYLANTDKTSVDDVKSVVSDFEKNKSS